MNTEKMEAPKPSNPLDKFVAYRNFFITTYTGKRFRFLDVKPEDIALEDIIHTLSYNCRYNGHCNRFFSVAEHSMLVADMLPPKLRIYGLLHDAGEAYITDIPRPFKYLLNEYTEGLVQLLESSIMHNVHKKFNLDMLPPEQGHTVKLADNTALYMESKVLFHEVATKDWQYGEMMAGIPNGVEVAKFPRSIEGVKEDFREILNKSLEEK